MDSFSKQSSPQLEPKHLDTDLGWQETQEISLSVSSGAEKEIQKKEVQLASQVDNFGVEMALTSLRVTGFPTHKILFAHLGVKNEVAVLYGDDNLIVINADRVPEIGGPDYTAEVSSCVGKALMLVELNSETTSFRANSHPLLPNDVRRVPNFIYDLAKQFTALREFTANYQAELMNADSERGLLHSFKRHSVAFLKALVSPKPRVRKLTNNNLKLIVPSELNPSGILSNFHGSLFTRNKPHEVIAASFSNELTEALKLAIAKTCKERDLPLFNGDPWLTLSGSFFRDVSDNRKALIKNFTFKGHEVAQWVHESQSTFRRDLSDFWGKLDERLLNLSEKAILEGNTKLSFGVVGVGMNEEALSLAIEIELFLDKYNFRDKLDYEIVVMSRDNPTMQALVKAEGENNEVIKYPSSVVPKDDKYRLQFDLVEGGFVPSKEMFKKFRFEIVDIANAEFSISDSFDMFLVHNVFQYIDSNKTLKALKNIKSITSNESYVSIHGDNLNIPRGGESQKVLMELRGRGI